MYGIIITIIALLIVKYENKNELEFKRVGKLKSHQLRIDIILLCYQYKNRKGKNR